MNVMVWIPLALLAYLTLAGASCSYVLMNLYQSSTCGESLISQSGYQCNTCIPASSSSSFQFECDADSVKKQNYENADCQGEASNPAFSLNGCGSEGYVNGSPGYIQYQCGTISTPTYDYYFLNTYSESQCNEDPRNYFYAKQGVCISNGAGSTVKYSTPYEYAYSDVYCQDLTNSQHILESCQYSSQSLAYISNGFVTSSTTDDDGSTNSVSCSDSPCPTSCPALHGPTESWTTTTGCKVYCKDQPVNSQCAAGGSGCSSSCTLAVGPVVGIAVGGAAFVAILISAVYYLKYGFLKSSSAMAQSEMV